jgi:hypothetical protein
VPTRSVDLIITELLVYRAASALFFIVVLVSSPTLFSSWPFALFFLVLRRRLFNSFPFALGLISCSFAVVCSAPASIIFIGFYTLVNAKTSSCELQALYLWCAPLYSRTTVHFTFLLATIAVFGVLVGRQHSSFQCVGVPHYHWYYAHRLKFILYLPGQITSSFGSALIKL